MKKFLRDMGLFWALQAALGAALFSFYSTDKNNYLAAAVDKEKLLAEAPSPRIIFVSGSSFAFGVDSRIIQDKLHYHPVNMALAIPLGPDFVLNEVEEGVRRGDVVVVGLEYLNFADDTTGEDLIWELLIRPHSVRFLRFGHIKPLLDNGLTCFSEVARVAVFNILGRERSSRKPYTRDSFNEFGDVVAHHGMPSMLLEKAAGIANPSETQTNWFIERLNRFQSACEAKGARVFAAYMPISDHAYEQWKSAVQIVQHHCEQDLKIPLLGPPDTEVYPVHMFFDSLGHLTLEGKEERSEMLVRELSSRLKGDASDVKPKAKE